MCKEWADDFWAFVKALGVRPENHTLRRLDTSKPLGPNNWEWKESTSSKDKACYAREWRRKNPRASRNSDLKKNFGISIDEYERMEEAQGHACAICLQPPTGRYTNLAVDHCHTTGKIRGLLCADCNRGIGLLKDDKDILQRAVKYVS